MKNIIEKIKKSWLIKRTTTILFMAALVALFIVLTLLVNSMDWNPIDFTADKLYTLTDTSKEQLAKVEKDVNIYFVGYSDGDAVIDLAKKYHNENNKINIETVTSTQRPDLVKKYGIEEGTNGVIVECGEKFKILAESDFYTYDMTTYEQIDITEEKLTNAILYVVAEKVPTVYFLEGYSDFSIDKNLSYLATYLSNEVTEHDTINLLTTGKVPEDCDTLIIMTPSKDFDEMTTTAITDYINNGGNILWFNMALTEKQDMPNVNKILALYGVNPFDVGIILESDDSKMMKDMPNVILPKVNYSTITKNIPSVLLVNATKLNFVGDEELESLNVTKTDLMQTTDSAFFRTDFTIETGKKQKNEETQSFIVGAELDKKVEEKTSKLVIYGENAFISDYSFSQTSNTPFIAYSYNKDLPLDSIAYLVDRQEDIVIRKDTDTTNYTATVEQNNIIQGIIFGVPVFIVFVGILVWQHRRRKK